MLVIVMKRQTRSLHPLAAQALLLPLLRQLALSPALHLAQVLRPYAKHSAQHQQCVAHLILNACNVDCP